MGTSRAVILRVMVALCFTVKLPVALGAAGDLDPAFGNGGVVAGQGAFPNQSTSTTGLALQIDGSLIAVGSATDLPVGFNANKIALLRVASDGTIDTSFGTNGTVTTLVGDNASANAVALQADGSIVVAGGAQRPQSQGGAYEFIVARYAANGTLDTGFGTGGTTFGSGVVGVAYGVALQSDNKIVAVGQGPYNGTSYGWRLARYNPDGSLDTNFGSNGSVVSFPFSPSDFRADGVVVQPDTKIVVVGSIGGGYMGVARYNHDGTLDSTFGSGGTVIFGIQYDEAYAVALRSDGEILAAGGHNDTVLGLFHSGGAFDSTFGSGGQRRFLGGPAYGVALRADGKIVGAGASGAGGLAAFRLNADGSLDAGFGSNGRTQTNVSATARAIVLQSDQKIVVAGDGQAAGFYLARYLDGLCGNNVVEPGEQCDDGNTANGDCCSSTCQYDMNGAACPAGNPCSDGVCDGAGSCLHPPSSSSTPCPDDGNPCTDDHCDGAGSCLHPPSSSNTPCPDDGNPCTDDHCDGAGSCSHPDNTAPCDDNDVCTINDVCGGGTCQGTNSGACFGGDDTGCIPTTAADLKCSDGIVAGYAKLIVAVMKCHCKQATAAFDTANGKPTTFDEEACETGPSSPPGKSAVEKFDAALAKLGGGTAPVCSPGRVSAAMTERDALLTYLDGLDGNLFCDGPNPIDPGGDDGGAIPTSRDSLKCLCGVGKAAGKLAASALTCHQKLADADFKLQTHGDDEACEEHGPTGKAAHDLYTVAVGKLEAKIPAICPACMDGAAAETLATGVLSKLDGEVNGSAYPCP